MPSLPPVLVVGTGLVGSSLGMALTRAGEQVFLSDQRRSHATVAASRGAGSVADPGEVGLVVVATPPSTIPGLVTEALRRHPGAVVTDVGSVKAPIVNAVIDSGVDHARYVPSHPMAGSQHTGPMTASADLFRERTWAVTPLTGNRDADVALVCDLAEAAGARVLRLGPAEHDEAVAQVSHVPHLMSILTAAHLREVPASHLQLAGQGIRDVTRVAGSDPGLWRQIIATNADAIRRELAGIAVDLERLMRVLDQPDELEQLLGQGRRGAELLSGKHGQAPLDLVVVTVEIPDEPRALARLFGDVGEAGFNVEDFALTHDNVREVGFLSISVERGAGVALEDHLVQHGWSAWSESKEQ